MNFFKEIINYELLFLKVFFIYKKKAYVISDYFNKNKKCAELDLNKANTNIHQLPH